MKSNKILIAHPSSENELGVIKAFFNALNIKFEEAADSPYDKNFINKIQKVRKSKNRTEIDPKNIWESIGYIN
jgi:hypothetical protein